MSPFFLWPGTTHHLRDYVIMSSWTIPADRNDARKPISLHSFISLKPANNCTADADALTQRSFFLCVFFLGRNRKKNGKSVALIRRRNLGSGTPVSAQRDSPSQRPGNPEHPIGHPKQSHKAQAKQSFLLAIHPTILEILRKSQITRIPSIFRMLECHRVKRVIENPRLNYKNLQKDQK